MRQSAFKDYMNCADFLIRTPRSPEKEGGFQVLRENTNPRCMFGHYVPAASEHRACLEPLQARSAQLQSEAVAQAQRSALAGLRAPMIGLALLGAEEALEIWNSRMTP